MITNPPVETEKTKADYALMQRTYYDERASTLAGARGLVHPNYHLAHVQAASTQVHALMDFVQRTYSPNVQGGTFQDRFRNASALPTQLRVLDFGCGVGRLMEPLANAGFSVDGVDISSRMLDFARENPALRDSQFFLSNGNDCGAAPAHAYDLVYSHLCIQHICSRSVRNELLQAFKTALAPGGVVFVQVHFYPDRLASTVPPPHVPWSGDNLGASATNSEADVWATPDQLHLVYEDFSRHFVDLRLQFVDFPSDTRLHTNAYKSWFSHLIVTGSVNHSLATRLYQPIHGV